MTYVQHHLEIAGAQRPTFSEKALKKLHQSTGGNARGLNNVAVLCLMSACTNSLEIIDDELVSTIVLAETKGGDIMILRPDECVIRTFVTRDVMTLVLEHHVGETISIELNEMTMWAILGPLLEFQHLLEMGPIDLGSEQETLPF